MTIARTIVRRVRGGIKRRALRALEALGVVPDTPAPPPTAPPSSAPVAHVAPESPVVAEETFAVEEPASLEAPEPETMELGLSRDTVEELLEDMVRPALQSDGGDITLVRVEPEGDVYVELVGACSTCPSATVTMRQGIERLMQAELPGFRSLIEVNGMGGPPSMVQ